jgi:phosphoribosylaminoimidazole carboxylase (NCAIR synthetase)
MFVGALIDRHMRGPASPCCIRLYRLHQNWRHHLHHRSVTHGVCHTCKMSYLRSCHTRRSLDGSVTSYPVVETIHKDNICHVTEAPADAPAKVRTVCLGLREICR